MGRIGLRFISLAASAALVVGCASSGGTSTTTPPSADPVAPPAPPSPAEAGLPAGCIERTVATPGVARLDCTVDAPSLTGNLLGDPATLDAVIWIPDDYDTNGEPRQVVYFLAGYTASADDAARTLSSAFMRISARPEGRPIIVMTDGLNAVAGSFYVDSPVTGNWNDAIAQDLVGFVDANFRTVTDPAGRGIAGHSMGGFGALSVAMHEPDVFGAVYALSPGLATAAGVDEAVGEDSGTVRRLLDAEEELADVPAAERAARLVELANRSGAAQFTFAYGLAFAPDPDAPALMRVPFRRAGEAIERDADAWAAWDAGFGDLAGKVEDHEANLRQLRGIGIDYGTEDEISWIPPGAAEFVRELRAAGFDVVEATYPGDHTSELGERMIGFMLPFFEERLAATD